MTNTTSPEILDLLGVECPDFILAVRQFFAKKTPGCIVMIRANVHNAARDINRFCSFGGHTLLGSRKTESNQEEFVVQKGSD